MKCNLAQCLKSTMSTEEQSVHIRCKSLTEFISNSNDIMKHKVQIYIERRKL